MNDKYFSNDIKEIKAFIFSGTTEEMGNPEKALNNITSDIDEEFLLKRAEFIRKTYGSDNELKDALARISVLCAEKCDSCPINKYCNKYIREAREKVNRDALKMIDLFCGAGGLSLGFTQEGFVTHLANDILECCVDTYAHNHPETSRDNIVLGDINDLVNNLEKYINNTDIDIVVGGPPCQGFSMANRQRIIDDPRNKLYRSFVEVVKQVNPKFFVMENVKGMLPVADQVIEDFVNIGYSVSAKVLNAKDYGVPQNRERLIYIGNRIGVDNDVIFSEIEASSQNFPATTLADALYGLKPLNASRNKNSTEIDTEESGAKIAKGSADSNAYIDIINQNRKISVVCNHKARYNNDRDIEIFSRLDQGDKSDDPKIADIMPYSRRNNIFKDKYFKLEENKVCKTITAHMKFDCNMYIHPTQARGLTPREAARVQSYPDDYFFRGAYTKTYLQIGNSVPPLLGRAIAARIKNYL